MAVASDSGRGPPAADRLTSEARTWASGASTDTVTYGYTNDDQITSVSHTNGSFASESFSYDANGNRNASGYTTGTGNRLTGDGTYTYTYDDEGNRTSRTETATGNRDDYTWDHRNRLIAVDHVIGGTSTRVGTYVYDALDLRIEVVENGATRATLYDGVSALLDFNGSGTQVARYLQGPLIDELLARETSGGTVAWYLQDRLNTVRDLVDSSGAVIDHVDYGVFGNVQSESSPSSGDRWKFTGRELDATGLYQFRSRYYDAWAGRFVSEDRIAFRGGDENLYRYALNQVSLAIDPQGLQVKMGGTAYPPLRPGVTPTARDLANNPTARRAYEDALKKSLTNSGGFNENGGWGYMNPSTGAIDTRPARGGHVAPPGAPGAKAGIDLSKPPTVPGMIVVCTYHIHPYNWFPSIDDLSLSNPNGAYGVPGIIIFRDGTITPYGPPRRGGVRGPQAPGFPPQIPAPPVDDEATLDRIKQGGKPLDKLRLR